MPSKTVAFPLYDGCTLMDFAGATQVFNQWASGYNPLWLAATPRPVTTTEGVEILPQATFGDVLAHHTPIDILFVPGGGDAAAAMMSDTGYIGFLKAVAPRCAWVGSVCTGAFPLAAAGLLDGCLVTTYWSQIDNLALFPKLRVAEGYPRALIDEERRRFTGGGVSSSIDLALTLLQRLEGCEARQISQLIVQYAPDPPLPRSGDPERAAPTIAAKVLAGQADFIKTFHDAVQKIVRGDSGGNCGHSHCGH